jgi:AmmeMemoRadiSam system protein A
MAPSPSLEAQEVLGPEQRKLLLGIARASIRHGLAHGRPLPVDPDALPPELAAVRGAFVTLTRRGRLRGCVGRTRAFRPLGEDLADLAYGAAFQDSRFPPVTAGELADLEIHVSLLTVPEPVAFTCDADLMAQLVPGQDGLILESALHLGVFLPSVWESLPDPMDFLGRLKVKAGLPERRPVEGLRAYRFRTESIGEPGGADEK